MLQTNDYILKEQETIERFTKSALSKPPYSVELNVRWHTQYTVTYFDILIEYNSIPLAVVAFILAPDHRRSVEFAQRQISNAFHFTDCHFGIITDHNEFYLCDKNNKEYQSKDLKDIITLLINYNVQQNPDNDEATPPHKDLYDILKNRGYNDFIGNLNENNGNYYFYNNYDESCFWQKLLNDGVNKQDTIYRYTSLDTAFWILKNKTYRMYGIVGMNDKSEVDYFDNYNNEKETLSYKMQNDLFLSSCSSSNDNLTMWRLYGDDAKGVCLVFDSKTVSQKGFLIQAVSYANEQGIDPKLEIIKNLINNNIVFKDIDKWKHFFKSKDYSVEQEVRVLFQSKDSVKKRDWIISKDYSIINPFLEFNIFNNSGFPLVLKEIILGPKCPEQETNIYQLNELAKQNDLSISIRPSDIKNYR